MTMMHGNIINYADTFLLKASIDFNQIHDFGDLNFDEKQLSVNGYPYRFGVANKIDGKTFYRCMECRNIKNKKKLKNEIVGTLIFHTKEKLLKSDVNAPGGHQHLCNDPIFRPLPTSANNNIIASLASRILIESTFYHFEKLVLKVANQRYIFKHIGCTEGVRYYACLACIEQKSLQTQITENTDHRFENDAAVSDSGDDFDDAVSASDSASNVGIKRSHSQDLPPFDDHNFDDIDSVVMLDEIPQSVPSPAHSSDIQPPTKRRTFSSYFNFSFIPSLSTS
uniref:Transposase n=1 Tax=Panagrolaimus superbus TaxID=310955 RepID=A0A914XTG1_9BILA